jgi:hypothetical protein
MKFGVGVAWKIGGVIGLGGVAMFGLYKDTIYTYRYAVYKQDPVN